MAGAAHRGEGAWQAEHDDVLASKEVLRGDLLHLISLQTSMQTSTNATEFA
jgi:hypothetical protein